MTVIYTIMTDTEKTDWTHFLILFHAVKVRSLNEMKNTEV